MGSAGPTEKAVRVELVRPRPSARRQGEASVGTQGLLGAAPRAGGVVGAVAETYYAFVDSIGDLFPDQRRDFILAGYDPLAVVDATASPYGPGPGGGGTYLSVALQSGIQ